MTTLPITLYVVVRDFGKYGIGSGDATPVYEQAYDQFVDAVDSHNPVMVLRITTANASPTSVADVTDEFERDLRSVCRDRDLDYPETIRFEDVGANVAASCGVDRNEGTPLHVAAE